MKISASFPKAKPRFTPRLDLVILETFHTDKGCNCALIAVDKIRRQLRQKVTESQVVRRATELGLVAPPRDTIFWSKEEDLFLMERVDLPVAELQRQFNRHFRHRTLSAIVARTGRLGGFQKLRGVRGFTMHDLARHLHVSKGTLAAWSQYGVLRGTKPANREWIFTREEVRRFVFDHPEHVDFTRVDKYWLLGLLDGRLNERDDPQNIVEQSSERDLGCEREFTGLKATAS